MSRSYLNRHLTSTENKSNTRHVNDTLQKPRKRAVNAPQKTRRKPIDAPQIRTRPKLSLRRKLIPGGSWGWPYKARHKRPRSTPIATLVFSPVLLFFFNRQSRIVSHMFALRFSAVLLGLEPPMFYLRKKNTKFDAKSDDRCSVSKGKWQKEAVLWAACTSRGGQYD